MKYKITNIHWDTDGNQKDLENLPQVVEVSVEDDVDIADALSDAYGFCVFEFNYERIA